MISLPDPLHPAIVHFPVVLILVGAAAAVLAVFWRGHQVPLFAGVLLALGAVGAWVAVETGESDGGLLDALAPAARTLLDEHQDWAERTAVLAAIGTVLAFTACALARRPRLARLAAMAAAVVAIAASYAVYETGHRGGALVFQHRAGIAAVEPAAATAETPTSSAAPRPIRERRHEERD